MSDYELFVEILKSKSADVRDNFAAQLDAILDNENLVTGMAGEYLFDGDPLKEGTWDCFEAMASLVYKAIREAGGTSNE